MTHHFEIEPRAAELGGVFPPELEQGISADNAYADALQAGEDCMDAFAESEA